MIDKEEKLAFKSYCLEKKESIINDIKLIKDFYPKVDAKGLYKECLWVAFKYNVINPVIKVNAKTSAIQLDDGQERLAIFCWLGLI